MEFDKKVLLCIVGVAEAWKARLCSYLTHLGWGHVQLEPLIAITIQLWPKGQAAGHGAHSSKIASPFLKIHTTVS